MDEQVKRAMARWPSVPDVYGWLRLGRRGTWFLIDRNAPGFDPERDGGGSPITSPPIIDFIHRNYEADGNGHWYFQNGPQRVFVTLDQAPLILRVVGGDEGQDGTAPLTLATHNGQPVGRIDEAVFDDDGNLFLQTDLGPGMLDDRDLVRLMADGDADSGRLALPHYGFAIDWPPADADADAADDAPAGERPAAVHGGTLPVDEIARRFGFRREPVAPVSKPATSAGTGAPG